LRHEIFLFSLEFSATLINPAKMGKCTTTIVAQSDWSQHCYLHSCVNTAISVATAGIWWAKTPKQCTKPPKL